MTDKIFFYAKSKEASFQRQYQPYSEEYIRKNFRFDDGDGRKYSSENLRSPNPRPNLTYTYKGYEPHPNGWTLSRERMEQFDEEGRLIFPKSKSGRIRAKKFLDEMPGQIVGNLWTDIGPLSSHAQERLGYPTQKPQALLERIISASSNPGDLVLDPFCGCGTAVDAAESLGRAWIGIDVTHLAIGLIERRMKDRHPHLKEKGAYKVIGTPTTIGGAQRLFRESPFQFERWAVSLIPGAREYKSGGGGDGGIDGLLYYQDAATRDYRQGLISVKGGKTLNPTMVRDLRGTVERVGNADFGIFISLNEPTQGMKTEAASAGFFETGGKRIPVMQAVTVEDLLDGRLPSLPGLIDESAVFKKAPKAKKKSGQGQLL